MKSKISKQGFTMVELIVVVAMLMILAGAVTTSVQGAHRRAKIQQAVIEANEMTKAILSYENYAKNASLADHLIEQETAASETTLGFILGMGNAEGEGQSGKVPVLYNAAIRSNGDICDPWGTPYYVTIKSSGESGGESVVDDEEQVRFKAAVTFPNYNRRPADELK